MDMKTPTLNLNVNRYRSLSGPYDDEEFCIEFNDTIAVTQFSSFSQDIILPEYIPIDVFRNPGFSRWFLVLKKFTVAVYNDTSGDVSLLHFQFQDTKNQQHEIAMFSSQKYSDIFNLNMIVTDALVNSSKGVKMGNIAGTSVFGHGTGNIEIYCTATFSIIYQVELLEGETKVEKMLGQLGKRVQHWEETLDVYFKAHENDQ
jgi:hypothetical protein